MDSAGGKSKFKAPDFAKVPGKDELIEVYRKYRKINGDKKFKVGVVLREKMKDRYRITDKFKRLDEKNILCTADVTVSQAIEVMMKDVLVEHDRCMNDPSDNANGCFMADKTRRCVVYLVELRDNLLVCAHRWCNEVRSKDLMAEHVKKHRKAVLLEKLAKKAKATGLKRALKTMLKPIDYVHCSWGYTHCEFCGDEILLKSKSTHRISCSKNPRATFPCSKCEYKAKSRADFDKHMKGHAKKEDRVSRNLPYKCRYCDESFGTAKVRLGHEKICDPSRKNVRYPCPYCDRTFTRNPDLTKHIKTACKVLKKLEKEEKEEDEELI